MIGDVFVTTFDGRMFLQPGACQYVLAKSRAGSRFTVTVQYTTCAEVRCITCAPTTQCPLLKDVTRPSVWYVSTAASVHSVSNGGVGRRCEPSDHFDQRGGGDNWCQPSACPALC